MSCWRLILKNGEEQTRSAVACFLVDQFGCHCGQSIVLAFGPAKFYPHSLTLNISSVAQAPALMVSHARAIPGQFRFCRTKILRSSRGWRASTLAPISPEQQPAVERSCGYNHNNITAPVAAVVAVAVVVAVV